MRTAISALAPLVLPALALLASCDAREPVFALPDAPPETRTAAFTIRLDASHPDLDEGTLEPSAGPVTVDGGSSHLALDVRARRPAARSEIVWLEVFVENLDAALALRDLSIAIESVEGASHVIDVSRDPFGESPIEGAVALGGVGPEGIAHLGLAVPATTGEIAIAIRVSGTTTARTATHSAPIAVTPDGSEVWAVLPDADLVAVIDARSDTRLAQIAVPSGPSSVAISPDGAQVLVASRLANELTVIDRASRTIVQQFGEEDGVGREPRHVAISPDGSRAFVSAYVGDSLTRLERRGDRLEVTGTLAIGRRPTGIAIPPDGATVLVTHFLPRGPLAANEAWVSVVDADTLTETGAAVLPDDFNVDRVHCLAEVFGVSPQRVTMEGVATQLSGIFLSPGGAQAVVPGMRIVGTPVIEAGPDHEDVLFVRAGVGRFAPPFMFRFDTRDPAHVEQAPADGVLDVPDLNTTFARCARLGAEMELPSAQPLSDGEQTNAGVAMPTGNTGLTESGVLRFVAYSRGGRRALALSFLADELVEFDASTWHPATVRHLMLSGSNPIGLAIAPDGTRAWVSYENSTFVSVLDLSEHARAGALPRPAYVPFRYDDIPGAAQNVLTRRVLVRVVEGVPELPRIEEVAQVALVDEDPVDPEVRHGRVLFSSSNPERYPTLTTSRQAACATCHPGGGSDGSAWATMEGERRTMSLRGGVAGRGWLHASGTHRGIEEFVGFVVRERLGGELGEDDRLALARHVASGIPRLQSPRTDPALVERGRALFAERCASCHAGGRATSGNPDPGDPLGGGQESGPLLFDVGTRSEGAGVLFGSFFESIFDPLDAELLGLLRGDRDLGAGDRAQEILDFTPRPDRAAGMLKAPSLVNVWDQAVFFHDARFERLEDAVRYLDDRLGLMLDDEDERAIVEYLRTL